MYREESDSQEIMHKGEFYNVEFRRIFEQNNHGEGMVEDRKYFEIDNVYDDCGKNVTQEVSKQELEEYLD